MQKVPYIRKKKSFCFFLQKAFKSCIWTSVAFMSSCFLQENNITFSFLFKIKISFALSPLGFYAENPTCYKSTPIHTVFCTTTKDATVSCWSSASILRLFSGGDHIIIMVSVRRVFGEFSELYSKREGEYPNPLLRWQLLFPSEK